MDKHTISGQDMKSWIQHAIHTFLPLLVNALVDVNPPDASNSGSHIPGCFHTHPDNPNQVTFRTHALVKAALIMVSGSHSLSSSAGESCAPK